MAAQPGMTNERVRKPVLEQAARRVTHSPREAADGIQERARLDPAVRCPAGRGACPGQGEPADSLPAGLGVRILLSASLRSVPGEHGGVPALPWKEQ